MTSENADTRRKIRLARGCIAVFCGHSACDVNSPLPVASLDTTRCALVHWTRSWRHAVSDIVPRSEVSRQGVRGVGAIVGGAALLILSALGFWGGVIIGGVLTVGGFALTGSKSDRTLGFIAAAAGILTIVSKVIHPLGSLFVIPGIGLLVVGAVSLFRFFSNLRKRS